MDDLIQTPSTPEPQPHLTPMAIEQLKATVPWMRFLAIVGMIMTGFIVLGGFTAMSMMPYGVIALLFYLVLALIIFLPQLYLLQYANSIRGFIASNNPTLLERAFERQKNYWTYLGILLIIYLAIVVLFLVVFAVAGTAILTLIKHTNPYMQQ